MAYFRSSKQSIRHSTYGQREHHIGQLKTLIFTLCLLSACTGQSAWRAVLERAGFYGSVALGASYEFNDRHAMDLTIGEYLNDHKKYHQTNLSYRYSRWEMEFDQNKLWRPLQIGFFTVRSWDRQNYFLQSPDKYPYALYYDETALRYGAEFGSTFTFIDYNFAVSYRLRILDSGLIAVYNNRNRDLQYYISSGLSFQYVF